MIARVTLLVWIAAWIVLAFVWAPVVPVLGDTTRVLYFHIPAAWVTVLALGWSMVQSVLYLRRRRIEHDDQAAASAELGILFCIVATISGSLWAKAMWGSYWNWDPRETSIFFLLLIYGAYLALRSAIEQVERRARARLRPAGARGSPRPACARRGSSLRGSSRRRPRSSPTTTR